MAETDTHKAGKRRAAGKRAAGGSKRSAGRIQVRSDIAEYRAGAQEQAARVHEAIDTALAHGRRMREEIEARIEDQWHSRPVPKAAATVGPARRRRRAKK